MNNIRVAILSVSNQTEHSTRRPLHPNDQVLTPKRARHPISSPVAGEPAGARSVSRPPIGPVRVSADPPAAAAVEPPRSTRLDSLGRDVDELLLELGVVGQLERGDQVRFETARGPDALHRRRATPCAVAIDRQLQCVPPAGVSSRVARTISATFSAEILDLRPRPGATCPNLVTPCAANRSRQAGTLPGETPNRAAIAVLATPSAANSNACARTTSRCGAVADLLNASRIFRWLSVAGIGAVAGRMIQSTTNSDYFGDTTLGSMTGLGSASPSFRGRAVAL